MELHISEKYPVDMTPTICLNMIVKNESHIIRSTLEKLCGKIHFSYWVICDTGSTDNTKEIIYDFFSEKNIPGELYVDEWTNFAHNRTLALERAFSKTDLLFIFDADDEIIGTIQMPTVNFLFDQYHLKFGSSNGIAYTRVLLINNKKRFVYRSVIHEFICCLETGEITSAVIDGDYYVVSGRSGSRSQDPQKYLKDAQILEKAYEEAIKTNDQLYMRYAFYCANSYKDYGMDAEAIKWYKKTLEHDNWAQEKYVSCLYMFECYERLKQPETGFFYLVKAFKYDDQRLECLYPLLVHYCLEGQFNVAYSYYLHVKDFYETKYLTSSFNDKLFVVIDKYNFLVPYYMILIADKVGDFDCITKMYEIVFTKKMPVANNWLIGNFLFNMRFFLPQIKDEKKPKFIKLANEYIRFLYDIGIPLESTNYIKDYDTLYGLDIGYIFNTNKISKNAIFSKETCVSSKNVLIYTGFMYFLWNDSYVSTKSIGGAEKAVAYLSRYFSKDYNIYVTGDVEDQVIDNVIYINRAHLQKLLESTAFHTIIISRYVSFFLLYKNFSCYQLLISAHDTEFINNYDNKYSVNDIIEKWNPIIDGCVALTNWHKNNIIASHPFLKDKIHIINNGILTHLFNEKNIKQKNKFVWTSCSYRGLNIILNLWDEILENIPDATLDIASYNEFPKNKADEDMNEIIIRHSNSIRHHGKLNTTDLNALISTAEYWLYTNTYPETSCITGMEMLMSEVICLYYPFAGLVDTIGDYGIQVNSGNEVETILNLTERQKSNLRKRGKEYALACSWENRAREWERVLFDNTKTRIYELHNIGAIPKNHVDFLQNLSKDFQPKVIYDLGANVLSWTKEARKIWPDAELVAFDAINTAEFLYKEHEVKYHIGVLSKEDNYPVKFYENIVHPAGNSYYKEIGHPKSDEIYPEEVFTEQIAMTLNTVVQRNNFQLPDLIKIDVQGAELDIIKGGLDVINKAKYLIVELQDTQYNRGAPLAATTIKFLEENGWELIAPKFCDNGPDADYCFKNKRHDSNLKWAFLIPTWYLYGGLHDYFDNLKTLYNLIYTKDVEYLKAFNPTKVTFVYDINDTMLNYCNNNNIEVSFLNTEPLTIYDRLQQTIYNCNKINNIQIYDYSKSNIKILKENGIINTEYLPYIITKEENTFLKELNDTTEKIYDFAMISHDNPISCIRRVNVVNFLMANGFKVHIIGNLWKEARDVELAKCKIVLNIHGQYIDTPSNIFEHLRCDRLLEAGYKILSEDSYCLDTDYIEKYKNNLQIITYDKFLNVETYKNMGWLTSNLPKPKIYCVLHSCTVPNIGTEIIDFIVNVINKTGFIDVVDNVFINNIGLPIENIYNNETCNKYIVTNYSNNIELYEYPTLNKIKEIAAKEPNSYILYLHAKGVCHFFNKLLYEKVVDWRNLMLYFLVETHDECINKLAQGYETVGCNYRGKKSVDDDCPIHYSGNFWWSKSSYINKLDLLDENLQNRQLAEFWLFTKNPHYYNMYSSEICHYYESYPIEKYSQNSIIERIIKSKKIIDCFIFYNEINMLTYRLNVLNDVVDYFILVEANQTFVGKPKPLYYNENKHLFEKFKNKIIHVVVDLPFDNNKINILRGDQWENERFQRNCISQGLDKLTCLDKDLIIISDVDEIPDPNTLKKIKEDEKDIDIRCLELDFYYYNLNSRNHSQWPLTKILSYKKYKELNTNCENIRNCWSEPILHGGWHLSYFGDANFIKNKIENFSHQECNLDKYTNTEKIQEKIDKCIDIIERDTAKMSFINIKDNAYLPPLYDKYLTEFYSKPKIIGFHSNQLCERGTEVAMYDYAYYNEKMYNNKSIIFYCKNNPNNNAEVIKKFELKFKCYAYENFSEIEQIIKDENIDYLYILKYGNKDELLVKSCPNLIHAVFTVEPHGERYAAVSEFLSQKHNNTVDYVPHMINLPKCDKNMRQQLNIPNDAVVMGRYGGYYLFDIPLAHEAIKTVLKTEKNIYFIFANTNVFYEHPRVIYLNKIIDLEDKVKFINTCDAMIHAGSLGETFGLAIGEFSHCNKPIITCKSDVNNSHIDILQEKAIIFNSEESLVEIFKNIKNIINTRSDWNAYKDYNPENVMKKFFKVFIDSKANIDYNKINYIDMSKQATIYSNENSNKNLVVVSAFLDINRSKWNAYNRTSQTYINSFLNYLNYDNKMVVFIDDKYIQEVKEMYEKSQYKNKIFIPINKEWMEHNIYAWQQIECYKNIMKSDKYTNLVQSRINLGNPENIYPEYNTINHSKIDFICYAIKNNYISENDFICWSDFGIFSALFHNNPNEYPFNSLDINKFNVNKISFCLVNKLNKNDEDMIYTLTQCPEKITGGFFAGPVNLMLELQKLYHMSSEELITNNISDDDQHVYLRCYFNNPTMFELYLSSNRQWPKGLLYFEKNR
jgi:beta-1,4-mannosyl-glycoprotein beta-1,4-N-acetylglucosaminyltransferase